jgi:GDP-L-fucose synthase
VILQGRRILVTGGLGFFGRAIVEALRQRGGEVSSFSRAQFDLRDPAATASLFESAAPELVVHAAGHVGGIGANRAAPGTFFYDNAAMGLNVVEQCRRSGVAKVVVIGTICSYPRVVPIPMREEDLWAGYPEETNAPYGLAKKMLLVQLQAYREQYGMNGIYLMPTNLYGPGDSLDARRSHVIPALIRRCLEAKAAGAPSITLWGTGTATREFLFVEDAAEAVALAAERYDEGAPLNLGGGGEISIRDLAALIARISGYEGRFEWDRSMPDGQPRRALDSSRARAAFGYLPRVGFEEGLRKTVEAIAALR